MKKKIIAFMVLVLIFVVPTFGANNISLDGVEISHIDKVDTRLYVNHNGSPVKNYSASHPVFIESENVEIKNVEDVNNTWTITDNAATLDGDNTKIITEEGIYFVKTESEMFTVTIEYNKTFSTISAYAESNTSKVMVDGNEVEIYGYEIDNSSYFRLKDIAKVLNGTDKQFDVTDNETFNLENITLNKEYKGSHKADLSFNHTDKVARLDGSQIFLDLTSIKTKNYKIDGEIYVNLRDLSEYINIDIGYDSQNNSILIKTK